jgi:hypothetical protein
MTHWNGQHNSFVNLNELADEDILLLNETAATHNNNNAEKVEKNEVTNDFKPVDLNAYKNKLEKKFGLRESNSSSSMFRNVKSTK